VSAREGERERERECACVLDGEGRIGESQTARALSVESRRRGCSAIVAAGGARGGGAKKKGSIYTLAS
jgi:hypothetical protein